MIKEFLSALLLSFAFLLFASVSGADSGNISEYRYVDGSGNVYVIAPRGDGATLEYHPVQPRESSSGVYSGGRAVTKRISWRQYEQILSLFDAAARRTEVHIRERLLGSGFISIKTGGQTQQYILAPDSPEKNRLETALNKLIREL